MVRRELCLAHRPQCKIILRGVLQHPKPPLATPLLYTILQYICSFVAKRFSAYVQGAGCFNNLNSDTDDSRASVVAIIIYSIVIIASRNAAEIKQHRLAQMKEEPSCLLRTTRVGDQSLDTSNFRTPVLQQPDGAQFSDCYGW